MCGGRGDQSLCPVSLFWYMRVCVHIINVYLRTCIFPCARTHVINAYTPVRVRMSVCLCLCIRNRSVRACEPVRSVCQCCTHACVLCRRNYGYVCVPAYVSHVRAVCVYMQVVKARIYTTSVSFLLSPLPAETVYIQSNPTRNALCVLKKKKKKL